MSDKVGECQEARSGNVMQSRSDVSNIRQGRHARQGRPMSDKVDISGESQTGSYNVKQGQPMSDKMGCLVHWEKDMKIGKS